MMSQRFLVVQLADIGDLIVSTPALAALRAAQPEAHITLLTTSHSAPVLNDTQLADEIILFDQRFNRTLAFFRPGNLRRVFGLGQYDVVIYLHHFTLRLGTLKFALIALATRAKRRIGLDNGNGWFLTERLEDEGFGAKHQAQYWLDLMKLVGADVSARGAVVGRANTFELIPTPKKKMRVAIHGGSGGYNMARRWDAENFAAAADALHEAFGAEIILVGSVNDGGGQIVSAMRSPVLDVTGQTTLGQLAAILATCDLFIGADSGVMHLAAAAGTPIVAIFGPTNAEAWRPWNPGGRALVVRSAPECSPCSYVRHEIGLRNGCAARTCMRMVSVEQVVVAAHTILNQDTNTFSPPLLSSPQTNTADQHSQKRIRILGLPVDAITYDEWLQLIGEWVKTSTAHHVCTINPEFIMIARRDVNFYNILSRAVVCVPDGVGLLWAAKHVGKPLPERVTGSDGVPKIAERAAREGWRLFFLGAAPGVADEAAAVLRAKHPDLQIVGVYSGSPAPEAEDAIVERVNASNADILFVAYGAPEQDKWIARNLPRLRVKMAMGVGGAFDFIAGVLPRAPVWMQRMGIEWLFRLYLQPWRIGRMMRLPRFVLAVLLAGKRS